VGQARGGGFTLGAQTVGKGRRICDCKEHKDVECNAVIRIPAFLVLSSNTRWMRKCTKYIHEVSCSFNFKITYFMLLTVNSFVITIIEMRTKLLD
jgi:hypothetical protein